MSETQMRVPLMHGLPKQTLGSTENPVEGRGHGSQNNRSDAPETWLIWTRSVQA